MQIVDNELLSRVFENRGYNLQFLIDMDCGEHGLLTHVDELCEKLDHVRSSGELIIILPDFDMDGIMSGVVGLAGLREMGFNANLFVPDPSDGYGFTGDTIRRLHDIYPDCKHIITCDVGISCFEGVDTANAMGMHVYVTDHHMQGRRLPSADVVVDPVCEDSTYAHPQICGAHVLYQCLARYAETRCDFLTQEKVYRLRVFAGIGTVSDRMPMLYENRALVRDSVSIARFMYCEGNPVFVDSMSGTQAYCRAFRGLFAVLKAYADAGKISSSQDIDESFYGFYMAPMFNSVKRMQGNMYRVFDVFFSDDAESAVAYLMDLNDSRKDSTAAYLKDIMDGDQPYAPYAYITDAPSGVAGLLAQKIMGMTKMPTLVLHASEDGSLHGSGRSPEWFCFSECAAGVGGEFAGHKYAFGCSFRSCQELSAVLDACKKEIASILETLEIKDDADFEITNIDVPAFYDFVKAAEMYKPYGIGFEEPKFKVRFKAEDAEFMTIGSEKQHVKIKLEHGFELLCWNQAQLLANVAPDSMVEVIGTMEISSFAGRDTVALKGDMRCA